MSSASVVCSLDALLALLAFDLSVKTLSASFLLESLALKFTPISKSTSRNKITVISFGFPSFSFLIFSSFCSFSRLTRSRSFSMNASNFVLIKVLSCSSIQNFPSKTSQCNTLTHSLALHHICEVETEYVCGRLSEVISETPSKTFTATSVKPGNFTMSLSIYRTGKEVDAFNVLVHACPCYPNNFSHYQIQTWNK